MPVICYIDVDAFAVSVERAIHPELRERPLIVTTQTADRGLVACASWDLRARGVRPGMPVSVARRRAEKALFLPPNPITAQRASRRLFSFLQDQAPVVELDKIDGFFLDMTGCERWMGCPVIDWMQRLVQKIRRETRLPVSGGIAASKLMARLATRVAKPGGILQVTPGDEQDFLAPVAVGLLPGVGTATRRELREFGIHTVGQLRALGEETVLRLYGHGPGGGLWRHAHGFCQEPVVATPAARMLEFDHAFEEDTSRPDDLEQAAALLAQRLCWEMRGLDILSCTARISLIYSDGHHACRVLKMDTATTDEAELTQSLRRAALLAFGRRVRVRSLHLAAALHQQGEGQYDFFQEEKQRRAGRLHAAIDQVRTRHGFSALIQAGGAQPGRRVKAAQATMEDLW